jgi:DNA invertase Pin-like site-specific DNA recombinase
MKKAAIYARVSTNGQTTDNQIRELKKVARRHGWNLAGKYVDHGISGAKGRDKRPELNKLLNAANRREFDVIMAWSVDRLGRSLQHLVRFLDDIHAKGVDLYLHQQNIDTSTPSGKAMFQMAGVFAEFERSMIQERVRAGLERAREKGKVLGRPKVSPHTEALIRRKRAEGLGILKIAKQVGVGTSVVQRVLKAA